MYADTVTVFNRYGGTWYATVLTGVDLNADEAAIMSRYGAASNAKALLHVKYSDGMAIGAKTYLPPKEWRRQTAAADLVASLTFTPGADFDFFIAGGWDGASVIQDDDYRAGFYDYCNKLYDQCYAVQSCAVYSVIPHLEIIGR